MKKQVFFNKEPIDFDNGFNVPSVDQRNPLWLKLDKHNQTLEFSTTKIPNSHRLFHLSENWRHKHVGFEFCSQLLVQLVQTDDYSSSQDDLFYLTDLLYDSDSLTYPHIIIWKLILFFMTGIFGQTQWCVFLW